MNGIQNEKQLEQIFERIVRRLLPEILRSQNNSIRLGIVLSSNPNSLTASVQVTSTQDIISNVQIQYGAVAHPGSQILLISPDPKNRNKVFGMVIGNPLGGGNN